MAFKVLFVCTGNTCRSPMAEAIMRRMAAERGLSDLVAESAGTSAWDGAPPSDGALLVSMERALDLTTHRARELSREVVASSDLILVMGPHHLERVHALGGNGKAHLLKTFASRGAATDAVSDPFGGDLAAYRETADDLEREVQLVLDRIAAERTPGGS